MLVGSRARPVSETDKITAICDPIVWTVGSSPSDNPTTPRPVTGITSLYLSLLAVHNRPVLVLLSLLDCTEDVESVRHILEDCYLTLHPFAILHLQILSKTMRISVRFNSGLIFWLFRSHHYSLLHVLTVFPPRRLDLCAGFLPSHITNYFV
jgi:hypothetical protein